MTKSFFEEVGRLRQGARSLVRELGLLRDAYFDIGVTLAERHLLIELENNPGFTAGEVSDRLLLEKSTTSRLIAKAQKKGYVTCTVDTADRRRRFVHLTALGKKTLRAFESIAHAQTQNALQSLRPEEVECVCQGVELYAQGLRDSRNRSLEPIDEEIPITKQFAAGLSLRPYRPSDETSLFAIYQESVRAGHYFFYESDSFHAFQKEFLSSTIFVCQTASGEVVGCFYIKPNFTGRAKHIANAGYMVRSDYRGQGIGSLLVKSSLEIARELGFLAMQYNLVPAQNLAACALYKKLGFDRVGTLPRSIRTPSGSYLDGYIFHRHL